MLLNPQATPILETESPGFGRGQAEWDPPAEFDGYLLKSCVGRGAMGRVYLAHDTVLDRPVAIKFIDALQSDPNRYERFLVEARAVARLQHPNVVGIYRIGETKGHPYFASEFVRGDRLDQIPRPVPMARLLRIGLGLARGLAAAHRRGVLHRDIKPANIIVCDGSDVKLVDFGIAKFVQSIDPMLFQETLIPLSPKPPSRSPVESSARPINAAEPPDYAKTQEFQLESTEPKSTSHLTLDGTVMGTPGYIAPEIWQSEPATFRSDVYSVGAVLYQVCTGRPPHVARTLDALRALVLTGKTRPVTDFGTVDAKFAAIVHRCLSLDPAQRFPSGEELREAIEGLGTAHPTIALPEGNPYRGLQAFEAEHRSLFFGRDVEIRAILDRLRNDSFVLVAGTSGVGKSSLCRAGVLPTVGERGLWDERRWTTVSLTPGKRPITALASAAASYLELDEEPLGAWIRRDWKGVYRELRKRHKEKGPLIVFIDQLEELVTLSETEDALVMSEVLESFSTQAPGLRLLATVRGDFLVRVASLPGLAEELTRALYLLKPLNADNVRQAIVGPARAKGVVFESQELVDSLVKSTTDAEGALPLLQFALAELWEARDATRGVISGSALDASGGVVGALARHADGVIGSLLPEQRSAARRLLMLLVTLEGTRARQTEKELGAENEDDRRALGALVRGRLLTATDSPEGPAYEVAHEALIKSWPTLRHWLEEDADRRVLRDRLNTAIEEWERFGRKREGLWSSQQLAEASILEASQLLPREKSFLQSSREALRTRRRIIVATLVAIVLALAGTFLGVRLQGQRHLATQVRALIAKSAATVAEARAKMQTVQNLRQQAFLSFDQRQVEHGEQVWAQVSELSAETDVLYANAGRSLEAAIVLGKDSEPAKNLLADILLERATLAEQEHRAVDRDELLARLRLYDDGTRRAKWSELGTLSVDTQPANSRITIQQYDKDYQGLRPVSSTAAPISQLSLSPGSYVLDFLGPDDRSARLLVSIRSGEVRSISVALPKTSNPDFVYIPPGRFLFGSDESARKDYFRTVPLHSVETGSYLIARNEATFADWLSYLNSLSSRDNRIRALSTQSTSGSVSLKPVGQDWLLTWQLPSRVLTGRLGEMFVLPGRDEHRSQDWRRLPVVAISPLEVEEFLVWLRQTGKVPGARLCTEYEWERAARGADSREYPHGFKISAKDANFDETYGQKPELMFPDEVGSHPRSRSPYGLDDMSGNALEFTRSSLDDNGYVLRGGGYFYSRIAARSTVRQPISATFRSANAGFRVCADPQ